ncbi:MAG TPA: squalene/phytoene synthase family protein [Thermoanaerobaculia bacterium]|nr:squalene/phytoene synthase family protein [Thermoanaerobaculia bacterium]
MPLPSVADSYAFCRTITHKHGANFSVGFRFLPAVKRRAVYAAYAYCRWADDIADEGGADVAGRLDEWERELHRCYAGSPQHAITIALADSLERFAIPKAAFLDLIEGCRQDIVKLRYETFDELLHYCHLVASSISDISLSIFGYESDDAIGHGRSLATALQLTNITRDVGDDLGRDRIYIPAEELARFGVRESDLVARRPSPELERLMLFQIERAEGYFRRAEPLLRELTFDARFPTLLMGSVYARVLAKIRREPLAPLERRVGLSTAEKIRLVTARVFEPHFV